MRATLVALDETLIARRQCEVDDLLLVLHWARLHACSEGEVWIGRKIAKMTRHLSQDCVGLVDLAVAGAMVGQSPARVFEVCEAKIIEADQAAHAARIGLLR